MADHQFRLRMPAALHARLDQAAERDGLSLNAALIDRLEASLATGNSVGGRIGALIGLVMDGAGRTAQHQAGNRDLPGWPDDPVAWAEACRAALYILGQLAPSGADVADTLPGADARSLGASVAAMLIEDQPASTRALIGDLGKIGARLGVGEPYDQKAERQFLKGRRRRAAK